MPRRSNKAAQLSAFIATGISTATASTQPTPAANDDAPKGTSIASLIETKPDAELPDLNKTYPTGSLSLRFFIQQQEGGRKNYPGPEAELHIDLNERLSADFAYDHQNSDQPRKNRDGSFDYIGYGLPESRLEKATLTYKAGDLTSPWEFTVGSLGELRVLEGALNAPGGLDAFGLGARQSFYNLRVDPAHMLGLTIKKNNQLDDNSKLILEGTIAFAYRTERYKDQIFDRGNSNTPSIFLKATVENTYDSGIWAYGTSLGLTQVGGFLEKEQTYISAFASVAHNIDDKTRFLGGAEIVFLTNAAFSDRGPISSTLNRESVQDDDRLMVLATAAIEHDVTENWTVWGEVGLNTDSGDVYDWTSLNDAVTTGIGTSYTFDLGDNAKLKAILGGSIHNYLNGPETIDTEVYAGIQFTHEF